MPIYEYACSTCGHEFEALVRADTTAQCPSCNSKELRKLLSVFATAGAATQSERAMPSPCGSCEHRGGPNACALN